MTAAQTESAALGTWTLKVSCNEDLRRLPSWPQDGAQPTFEAIDAACRELFDLGANETFCIKYTDDDGDVCTLTQVTLQDALSLAAKAGGVLRLRILRESSPRSSAATAAGSDLARALLSPAGSAREVTREPSRLCRARPVIQQNFKHFKERVAGDFRTTQKDMREAFSGSTGERPGRVPIAAGCLAGVMVASKMAPIRGLKLIARSMAAVCRPQQQQQQLSHEEATVAERHEAASWSAASVPAEQAASSTSEEAMEHFKSQVGQDFDNAREDVMAAITSFTGPPASKALQGVLVLVTAGAGACVAGSLVPIRATRLTIATVTSQNAPAVDVGSVAAPSVVEDLDAEAQEVF